MKELRNTCIVDWNIHIVHGYDRDAEVHIIDAVPGTYKVVFVSCGSWEDAEKVKMQIEEGSI